MALTEALAAQTTAATSNAISLSGPTKFVADDLSDGESVAIHRIRVDGAYEAALIGHGQGPIVLTKHQPGVIIEDYAEVKVIKGVTVNAVAVGYAS